MRVSPCSVADPCSVVKPDFKNALVGRIARAAAIFCVDEIVVFDDDPVDIPHYVHPRYRKKSKLETMAAIPDVDEAWQNPDQFMYHVLSLAECPPYLRTDLFDSHPNLKWAAQLPSLAMPHHLKAHEWCRFREGVALGPEEAPPPPKAADKKKATAPQEWTYIKCGLPFPIKLPIKLAPRMRVTLRFTHPEPPPHWPNLSRAQCEALQAEAAAPSLPREEAGFYWGYAVRRATSLSDVFTSCDFPNGYDVSIGTSERGAPLVAVLPSAIAPRARSAPAGVHELVPRFKHLLVAVGGLAGLEPAVAADPVFRAKGLTKETAHEAFDAWVNLVQGQGSRTVRTEEAVELGLFGLKGYVDSMYE